MRTAFVLALAAALAVASATSTPQLRASAEAADTTVVEKAAVDAPMTTCGGNCPSNDCPGCPCGSTPSKQDIAAMCAKYGGWDQACCQCIMSHESGGNANAANYNSNGSYDVGLWQVNSVNWASCSGGDAPCDPSVNLQCAIKVWAWGGNSFKLWSTCGGCGCC